MKTSSEQQDYREELSRLSDEELVRIATSSPDEYRPEAIVAAKDILRTRGRDLNDSAFVGATLEESDDEAAASENYVATRPLLLKAIAAVFFVFPLAGLALLTSGRVPMPPHPDPYYVAFVEYSLRVALLGAEVIGAVLLWRLRRSAFNCFAVALILGILTFWWHVLIRGWVAMTYSTLRGTVIGAAVLLNVCVYTWRLRSIGLLK